MTSAMPIVALRCVESPGTPGRITLTSVEKRYEGARRARLLAQIGRRKPPFSGRELYARSRRLLACDDGNVAG